MRLKASRLFSRLRCGESECLHRIYYVNGQLCYLSASKVKNRKGQSELQIVISFNQPQNAQELYRERWQIETAFRALKSSGFNIEDTHLTDIKRIEKLFSPVTVAFARAYVAGIYVHENIKQIKIKKHGNRARSLFKYGLQFIATVLLNPLAKLDFDVFKFLACTWHVLSK
jgi:hypothetical protein